MQTQRPGFSIPARMPATALPVSTQASTVGSIPVQDLLSMDMPGSRSNNGGAEGNTEGTDYAYDLLPGYVLSSTPAAGYPAAFPQHIGRGHARCHCCQHVSSSQSRRGSLIMDDSTECASPGPRLVSTDSSAGDNRRRPSSGSHAGTHPTSRLSAYTRDCMLAGSKPGGSPHQRPQTPNTVLLLGQQSGSLASAASCEDLVRPYGSMLMTAAVWAP